MCKKYYPLMLLLATFFCVFTSCRKEESVPFEAEVSTKLAGTYDFVGMSVDAVQTVTSRVGNDVLKAVMITHYDTKNNTGTTIIAGSSIQNSNYGYRMEAASIVTYYLNGIAVNEEELTSDADIPASSNVLEYKLKGVDSIHMTGGNPYISQTARYYWKGDTLIFSQRIIRNEVVGSDQSVADIMTLTKMKKRK